MIKCKILLIFFLVLCFSNLSFSQKNDIKIILLPSDDLLNKYGFIQKIEENGMIKVLRKYHQALENMDLVILLREITKKFNSMGYKTNSIEEELKSISISTSNDAIQNDIDLKKVLLTNSNILIEVNYNIIKGNLSNSISYSFNAYDATTGKLITSISNPGNNPNTYVNISEMLGNQIEKNEESLKGAINYYFSDYYTNVKEKVAVDLNKEILDKRDYAILKIEDVKLKSNFVIYLNDKFYGTVGEIKNGVTLHGGKNYIVKIYDNKTKLCEVEINAISSKTHLINCLK